MVSIKLVALALVFIGIVFAVLGVLSYSNFIAKLQRISPKMAEEISLESTENWSNKNWAITGYFWSKRYLGTDMELNKLGNSVRSHNIIAVSLIAIAMVIWLASA
ncbi:MAG: hypothetical protein B7Y56_15785 [Gallionellales bacterium 35-53-114]|jgi:uncharacterized membrane protein YqhA|nr:MAG: hypothetical protein B7Y56_15785 [Gallionellales bacterium 35-53-114]OYZ62113.1 MAG: hypothetical protein B7Y04_15320 [Gallionellales bacterium 24-53-125]HQS59825.1 hypothetical protein [Gallionellaceae bacterium]HQS76579.1 hypothetical protein [Gallionellaceae bacterium]